MGAPHAKVLISYFSNFFSFRPINREQGRSVNLEAHVEDHIMFRLHCVQSSPKNNILFYGFKGANNGQTNFTRSDIACLRTANNNRTRPKCIKPPAVTMYYFYSVMRSSFACQWVGHSFKRQALKQCFKLLMCILSGRIFVNLYLTQSTQM